MRCGGLAMIAFALSGCFPNGGSGGERYVRVAAYAAPSADARSGVLTYHPWSNASFPVVVSQSGSELAALSDFSVVCRPELACQRLEESSTAQVQRLSVSARDGKSVQLTVSKDGYEDAAATIALEGRERTYLIVLRPSSGGAR